MHVGHYNCTFPITGINKSKIGFKPFFSVITTDFVPTMSIYKQGNIIYHIQLI